MTAMTCLLLEKWSCEIIVSKDWPLVIYETRLYSHAVHKTKYLNVKNFTLGEVFAIFKHNKGNIVMDKGKL